LPILHSLAALSIALLPCRKQKGRTNKKIKKKQPEKKYAGKRARQPLLTGAEGGNK